jgi:hypothetical protein
MKILNIFPEYSGRSLMLTTKLIPVSRLKIGGAIALLFHCYQGFRKDKDKIVQAGELQEVTKSLVRSSSRKANCYSNNSEFPIFYTNLYGIHHRNFCVV